MAQALPSGTRTSGIELIKPLAARGHTQRLADVGNRGFRKGLDATPSAIIEELALRDARFAVENTAREEEVHALLVRAAIGQHDEWSEGRRLYDHARFFAALTDRARHDALTLMKVPAGERVPTVQIARMRTPQQEDRVVPQQDRMDENRKSVALHRPHPGDHLSDMLRINQRARAEMHLLERIVPRFEISAAAPYPFCLRLWASPEGIAFPTAVTFLTGDNGSGKSTLLETIAAALRLPALAQREVADHPLMKSARETARKVRLVKRGPIRRGFFFRADDVTGFVQAQSRRAEEHRALANEYAQRLTGEGRRRAEGMARAQADAITQRYGEDPFARSHGELFFTLFRARITAPGLYLMDEPEAPLSPTNQIALLALMLEAVASGSQFIVATHSPILMALPDATLLDFNVSPPAIIDWEDTEHVGITRAFLNNPASFLRHMKDDDE